jgi:hypothetical protein
MPLPLLHGTFEINKARSGFPILSIAPITLVMVGIPDHSLFGELPKIVQTCLICHDKSL